jgi:hypothetical protein
VKTLLTILATVASLVLLVVVWYIGYEEGWRQATVASRPAVEGAHTPPQAFRLRLP